MQPVTTAPLMCCSYSAHLPLSLRTEEERRVAGLSYDGLVVRLNSVQHLLDSLGGLERMVVDRWVWAVVLN